MKTNLDGLFKVSDEIEKEGVWFMVSETAGFLVKRFNRSNPNVKAAFAAHFKPYARQIELGTLDQSKEHEIMVKIFVQSSLKDWKGIEIDGAVCPFNKDKATEFFIKLPDLFDLILQYASDFKNYREDLGNS
jgi:hypothetical protein